MRFSGHLDTYAYPKDIYSSLQKNKFLHAFNVDTYACGLNDIDTSV